jgi:hypothetical protein
VDRKRAFHFPPGNTRPDSVLADCVNLESTTGQEFRAVFVEAASTGPRALLAGRLPEL